MRRAVAYVRVSREDENPQNQIEVIREWCRENGYDCIIMPPEVEVARTTDPFERPVFRQAIEVMELSGIDTLVVESIDRLLADPSHWDKVQSFFTQRGWRIVFIRDTDITESMEKVIRLLDELKRSEDKETVRTALEVHLLILRHMVNYYWKLKAAVAKDYVEDVRRKVKRTMERLRREGRVYAKPTLVEWLALYRTGKSSFSELEPGEILEAARYLYERYGRLHAEGVPLARLWKRFLDEERPFIEWLRARRIEAARRSGARRIETWTSYNAFRRALQRAEELVKAGGRG